MRKQIKIMVGIMLLIALGYSCNVNYSMSGVTVPEDLKTISVENFDNKSSILNPNLTIVLSQAVRNIYTQRTNLELTADNADLQIKGRITGYDLSSIAIQGDDRAGLNRLTIKININFTNTKTPEKSFQKEFSRYQDFESTKNLSEVESKLSEEISNQLANDLFNATLSDW